MTPQQLPRPLSPRDLSLKLDDATPYRWANVGGAYQSATQGSMDQLEESRLMILLQLMRALRPLVGAQKKINRWVLVNSGFSHIFRDLNPVYQMDKLDDGEGGEWTTDASGKHYSIENYALGDFQKLCLSRDNFTLVSKLPRDFLDLLNLRERLGRMEIGADFTLPAIPPTYDKAIARQGPITADRLMRPLSTLQLAKLTSATLAHQHGSDPVAHPDEEASHQSVQMLLQDFEHSATDEEQRHFFQLMQFNAGTDPRWSASDLVLIRKLEDITWNEWDRELRTPAPNWGHSRYWEIAHQQAHALSGFCTLPPEAQMLYRFPCFDHRGNAKPMHLCPEENQQQVMARLRAGILIQEG